MTVAAGFAPEPEGDRFDIPASWQYRDPLIERAAVRATRVWHTESEPMWSATPIIGYRRWMMHPDGITGVTGYRWPGSSITAVCRPQSGEAHPGAPHRQAQQVCSGRCGINSYATPGALVTAAGPARARQRLPTGMSPGGRPRPESLYGAVALSGRVVEHEDGYRAEHATVIGLILLYSLAVRATSDPRAIDASFRGVMAPGTWETQMTAKTADEIPTTVADQLRRTAEQCV